MPQVFLKYSTGSGCVTKILPDNFLAQPLPAKQPLPSTTTELITQTDHLYAEPTIHEAMCQLLPTIFTTQPQQQAFPEASSQHHTSGPESHTNPHNIYSDFNMICNNILLHPNHLGMSFSTFCEAMTQPATTTLPTPNTNDLTIHLLPKLRGGKGGFGANLRSGAPKKKKQPGDDNQMRTLTGERLGRVQEREMMAQFEADLRAEQRASGNGHLNEVTRVRLEKKKPNNNNNNNNNNNAVQNTNSFSGFAAATTTSIVAERKNELSAMQLTLQKKLAPKTPTTAMTTTTATTTTTTTLPKPTTTTSSSALDFGFGDYSDSDDSSDSEGADTATTTQAVEVVVVAEETKEKPDAPQEQATTTPTPPDDKEAQQNQLPVTIPQTTEQE